MSELSQIQRLVRILQILNNGRKITTGEIRRRLGESVSLRTIQRDMIALSESGIPLVSEKSQSNQNVWYIVQPFRSFIPLPLDTHEYLAAHVLKANLKVFRKTPFEKEVNSLLQKIDQIVPDDVFLETQVYRLENMFENFTAGLFDYAPFGEIINDLISAILHHTTCQVNYFNPYENREKSFAIEPERMVYYNGALYVIVYVRKYRNFILLAVQRIRNLRLLDETFPNDHPFDAEQFWQGKFGLFPGEQVKVRLRFSPDVVQHIEGRQWHPTQSVDFDPEGHLILSMNVGITPELITWILGWRMFVKVLEPAELVQDIQENIRQMTELYKTT